MRHPINPRKLRAFQAVMTSSSVTEAANRLHLTQSAVSRLISTLQEEIGVVLFQHRGGRLEPTLEGREFFHEAERYLQGLDEIDRIADDIRLRSRGRLRIVAVSHLANWFLPHVLERLEAQVGNLRVSLEIGTRKEVERWIAGLQFDLGIAIMPVLHATVTCTAFSKVGFGVQMPSDHHLVKKDRLTIEDLVEEEIVVLQPSSLLRQRVETAFARIGSVPRIRAEAATTLIACQIARSSLALVDRLTALSLSLPGTTFRPLDDEFDMDYGYILPAAGDMRPHVKSALAILREEGRRRLG